MFSTGEPDWLRGLVEGVFAAFAAFLIVRRERVSDHVRSDDELVRTAIAARQAAEAPVFRALQATGAAIFVLAVLVLLLTRVPTVDVYALTFAAVTIAAPLVWNRYRRLAPQRFASLRPRTAGTAVPAWLWPIAAVSCLSPIAAVEDVPAAAAIVSVSATLMLVMAAYTASRPSLSASGVEGTFVDVALRRARTAQALGLAINCCYFFAALELWAGPHDGVQAVLNRAATLWGTFALFACVAATGIARRRAARPPHAGSLHARG
jgi:hypothetical protein